MGVGEDLDGRRVSCGGDEVDVDGRSMGLADGSDAHGDGEPADEHNGWEVRRGEDCSGGLDELAVVVGENDLVAVTRHV